MKAEIFLKDPDGFYESVRHAANESVQSIEGLNEGEREELAESRVDTLNAFLKQWVEYGECVTLIADTEAGTLTVKKLR